MLGSAHCRSDHVRKRSARLGSREEGHKDPGLPVIERPGRKKEQCCHRESAKESCQDGSTVERVHRDSVKWYWDGRPCPQRPRCARVELVVRLYPRGASRMQGTTVGLDLAKRGFQVHGVNKRGRV